MRVATASASDWFGVLLGCYWGLALVGSLIVVLVVLAWGRVADSRLFTVPFRAAMLVLAIVVVVSLVARRRWTPPGGWFVLILLFWGAYGLRIVWDGYRDGAVLPDEPLVFALKAFGMTFVPMLAFCFVPRVSERKWIDRFFLWGLLVAVFAPIVFYRDYLGSNYRALRYDRTVAVEALFPALDWAYAGATAICCGVAVLMTMRGRTWRARMLPLALIVAGLLAVVFTSSRGPFVTAALVCGLTLLLARPSASGSRVGRAVVLALAALAAGALIVGFTGEGMLFRFSRLVEELESGDLEAGSGRVYLWITAVNQWLTNPMTGSGLTVEGTLAYPHNHVIEAFMSTGMVGGVAFLALSLACLRRAVRILQLRPAQAWMAAFFLVQFLAGCLSRSVTTGWLWFGMVMVLCQAAIPGTDARPRSLGLVHRATPQPAQPAPA